MNQPLYLFPNEVYLPLWLRCRIYSLICLISFLCVFIRALNIGHILGIQIDLLPALLFYWCLYLPFFITPFFLLIIGVICDSLFFEPLGINCIIFIFLFLNISLYRRFLMRCSVYKLWAFFAFCIVVAWSIRFSLLDDMKFDSVGQALLKKDLLTIFIFPWTLHYCHKIFVKVGQAL